MQLEYWTEDKAAKIENQSIRKDYLSIQRDIDQI